MTQSRLLFKAGDYFLDSADGVHYFVKVNAVNPAKGTLKEEYTHDKMRALNKAGHGLHLCPGPFATSTKSPKVGALLRELGWAEPVVPQSMYIFKQASGVRGGGEVTSHQDSCFLHTEPRQTCVGLWLALDDPTLTNGCLWVRPRSHMETVRRRFVRNPKHFGTTLTYNGQATNEDGDRSELEPQMVFHVMNESYNIKVPWEGRLPKHSLPAPECSGLHATGVIPVLCKAGDLVVFVGTTDHLSLPNTSDSARHTFHMIPLLLDGVETERTI